MFESDDENFKWNGKVNNDGEECLDGVYFYTAKIKSHSGEVRKENGFIHLVR